MNKREFVNEIARRNSELTQADAGAALDTMIEIIEEQLTGGAEVNIPGFGKFSTGINAARTGRNPATGEAVKIKESTRLKFQFSKAMKDRVNGRD